MPDCVPLISLQFIPTTFSGLMKDPPMAPVGRNGPNSFINQGQQQGAVLMIYNLNNDTSNTDKLFNLLCLYGNVARVCSTIELTIVLCFFV